MRADNFRKNNYIEYESNGNRNKNLSAKENLNDIKLYLKDIITYLLYCKCHKIIFKCGGSYTDSPDWIKKKKVTINPKIMMIIVFNMQQRLH